MVISSFHNEKIKYLRSLFKKKYRQREKKLVLEGLRLIKEAYEAGSEVELIFVSDDFNINEFPQSSKFINQGKLIRVKHDIIKRISPTQNPQGIMAVVSDPSLDISALDIAENGRYLLLDRVQDPGNLGTIIRTAAGAGFNGVIINKGTVDPFNDKALRASMGGIFRVPIFQGDNHLIIKKLKEAGVYFYIADIKGAVDYYRINFNTPFVLVVGNEAQGVSRTFIEAADRVVKIPLPGGIESLNVSIAAGILIYHSIFQNNLEYQPYE